MKLLVILFIGLVAGNVTGLIGASGVMVVVPALAILGYATPDAIGASLFIDTIASLVVAWTYYQSGNLVVKRGIWIAVGSVLGAQVGSYFSSVVPSVGLGGAFSLFLAISAAILWIKGKRGMEPREDEAGNGAGKPWLIRALRSRERLSGLLLGLLVGVISGLFGAGGGIMILLILVLVMKFSLHAGIGTSTLIMAFTAASGAIGHAISRNLPIEAALVGSLGTVLGGRLSASYANKVDERILSKVAAGLFLALSVAMALVEAGVIKRG